MKIGIVIPTYRRPDGSTRNYLIRCLESIKNQTHTDYMVYLIGDMYDDNDEFVNISNIITDSKIVTVNLPMAVERDRYPEGGRKLWASGGVNATNVGIDMCLLDGIDYICHLDHDDWWESNHLDQLSKAISSTNADFAFTCSTYMGDYLPRTIIDNRLAECLPIPSGMVHSSTCINFRKLDLRYRDTLETTGVMEPADHDLWIRMGNLISRTNSISINIRTITCNHEEEFH